MTPPPPHTPPDKDLCIHIYTISTAMIGVCLIRIVITLNKLNSMADDLLCLDAVIFLFATLTAYWALRMRGVRRLLLKEEIILQCVHTTERHRENVPLREQEA